MLLNHECLFVLVLACLIDFIIGDPAYAFHPVRLIGNAISVFENFLRNNGITGVLGGLFLFILVITSTLGAYLTLHFLASFIHPFIIIGLNIYVVYSCFAFRDLINHIKPIVSALTDGEMLYARQRVSRVVGRDVSQMDSYQVARAAIETVAENFIDGILSPLFWYAIGTVVGSYVMGRGCEAGVVGMLLFKAVSTMDSMVGYRNRDYEKLGKTGARVDDVMNFIPARLSIIPLSLASFVIGQNTIMGIKIFFRDRLKHLSPNSAHGESFIAGALNIRLGGPSKYQGKEVSKPWLGDGSEKVPPEKVSLSCRLIFYATLISIVFALLVIELLRR